MAFIPLVNCNILISVFSDFGSEKAGEIPLLQEDGGGAGYGPQPRNMQASALKVVADEVRALILKVCDISLLVLVEMG